MHRAEARGAEETPPVQSAYEIGGGLVWTGVVAILVGCGVPLLGGVVTGWSLWRMALYVCLSGMSLILFLFPKIPALCRMIGLRIWRYVVPAAIVGVGLLALSGDPFIQPIVLTVPFVTLALVSSVRRTLLAGAALLSLVPLGLLLGGAAPQALLPSMAAYGAIMALIVAFVRMALRQNAARIVADRLAADLERQRDELARLNAQVEQTATLAERNRLARELHDTLAQELTAVLMQLEAAQRSFDRDPARTRARITRAHELARAALDHVRRSVWTLAEPLIGGESLAAALQDSVDRFAQRTRVSAALHHVGPLSALSAAAATQVVRIVQEALTNCEKHAQASHVWVESLAADTHYQVVVRDDGVGFDAERPAPLDRGGFGLTSLRERARLAGGDLQVESAPGAGTIVRLIIPIGERESHANANHPG